MKQIQPVSIWDNGQIYEAKILDAYVIKDDLSTFSIFWWGLFSEGTEPGTKGTQVSQGNLTMNGQDYIDWNTNPDINDDAYTWIAAQLNLTII